LQVRAPSASPGRRSLHVAAAPRPQAQVAVQPGRPAAARRLDSPPDTMTTERSRHLAAPLRSLTRGRSSRAPGLLGRHEVDLITAQPLPATTATSTRRRAGQQACISLGRQVPTQAVEEPVVDTAGDDEPGDRGRALPAHRHPPRPHGRTQRTRERTDTGHSTLDTGRRTPGRSDAHTGHWTALA